MVWILAGAGVVVTGLLAGVTAVVGTSGRRLNGQLATLTEEVKRLEAGDSGGGLPDAGPDSIRKLAQAVNELLTKAQVRQQEMDSLLKRRNRQLADRGRMQELLEIQVRAVYENVPEGILVLTPDASEVLAVNERLCEFSQVPREELSQLSPEQIPQALSWPMTEAESFQGWWRYCMEEASEPQVFEWELREPERETVRIKAETLRDSEGEAAAMKWTFEGLPPAVKLASPVEGREESEPELEPEPEPEPLPGQIIEYEAPEETVDGSGTRKLLVLVIEDEEPVRELMRAILKQAGFETVGAPDGTTGLELCRERRGEISLVVLDLNLPEMNGIEFFRVLRDEEMDDTPVIVASAYSVDLEEFQTECQARPVAVLQKPFQANRLTSAVESVLMTQAA